MASRKITPIPYRKLVKVFEWDGFTVKRQRGDHIRALKDVSFEVKRRPGRRPVTSALFSASLSEVEGLAASFNETRHFSVVQCRPEPEGLRSFSG